MVKKENEYFLSGSALFWGEVARLLDIGSTLTVSNDEVLSLEEENFLAMKSDWKLVAYDLNTALNGYANELRHSKERR